MSPAGILDSKLVGQSVRQMNCQHRGRRWASLQFYVAEENEYMELNDFFNIVEIVFQLTEAIHWHIGQTKNPN
jgi:hypothetical protein